VTFLRGFVGGYQGVAMQFDFKFLPGGFAVALVFCVDAKVLQCCLTQ